MSDARAAQFGGLAGDRHGGRDDRPLVFLHGLGFSRRHWTPVIRELESVDPGRGWASRSSLRHVRGLGGGRWAGRGRAAPLHGHRAAARPCRQLPGPGDPEIGTALPLSARPESTRGDTASTSSAYVKEGMRRRFTQNYRLSIIMTNLRLRPMTDSELKGLLDEIIPDYAARHVEAGDWDPDQATDIATRQVYGLLPDGVHTPGMLLCVADTVDAERVGRVWIGLNQKRPGHAYIYYIEVDAPRRGRGYGRLLLSEAEKQARRQGARTIGLHVFGMNKVARALYESAGYEVAQLDMQKLLVDSPGAARRAETRPLTSIVPGARRFAY